MGEFLGPEGFGAAAGLDSGGFEDAEPVDSLASGVHPGAEVVENGLAPHCEGRPNQAEIDFLVAYTKANIEGSKGDILSYWHASAKGSVQQMLENDELFKKNQAYMARNPGLVVVGLVKHKDSVSVLQGRRSVLGITMKAEKGTLYLIEKPENDLELAIIEASFIR